MFVHWALLIVVCGTAIANDICQSKEEQFKDYTGPINKTKSGKECKIWKNAPSHQETGNHNMCRNPDGDKNGVWCYKEFGEEEMAENDQNWDICDVPKCDEAIDGGWSAWGDYEACSATCGQATKKRVRTCTAPAPQNGGAQCDGPSQETVECGLPECAVDGGWSAWGDYEPCRGPCGNSTKKRERTCTAPVPQNGGAQCDGPSKETVECGLPECLDCDPCEYGRCDRGGRQHCLKLNNYGNGRPGYNCILPSSTCPPSKKCFKYKHYHLYTETKGCAVDGGWSAWGDYEPCRGPCGQSTKKRERTCTAPAPQIGGAQCDGPSQETVECGLPECLDCDPCEYGRCDRGGRQHCLKFKNRGYHCILPNSTCPPSKSCFKHKHYHLYTEKKQCFKERKFLTRYGKLCTNPCTYRGEKYMWCNTKATRAGWDYCSANNMSTRYAKACKEPCSNKGYNYYWCYRKSGGWDYCSPAA